ncbi:MAG: type II toxin-antitoxin system prevent-host-death family antitoxin [Desulfobacterales bacterium]
MESLSVSEFKAKCLSVLQDVNKQKKRVIITKRGKPIAEVIPHESEEKEIPLEDTVVFMGDIISPVAEEDWEILK